MSIWLNHFSIATSNHLILFYLYQGEYDDDNEALLQVALPSRIFIFKLDQDGFSQNKVIDETQEFAEPEKFIDLGL